MFISVCDPEYKQNLTENLVRGSNMCACERQVETLRRPIMMKMMRWALVAILCVVVGVKAYGQSAVDGAIGGTVMDSSDSLVPGAKVLIHNNDTNAEQATTADSQAFFRVVHLQPGSYTVTVTAGGFTTYESKQVVVQVGLLTTLDPKLRVGSEATTVEVSADAPVLNFTSPDFASNLDAQTINSLPINGRRWSDLTLLTPGVVADSNGFGLLSFRGISPLLNNIEIDGADDNQAFFSEERGRTREGYSTSQGMVREFQVNSGVYSAEYGRAAGGVVNSVTKSGTNQLHGQLYFYDRDNDWGATNPFTKKTTANYTPGNPIPTSFSTLPYKPTDWRKEWGLAVGGPLIKNRLFWFYAYDQYRRNFPGTAIPSSPTVFFTVPDASLPSGYICNTTTGAITGPTGGTAASTIDTAACVLAARLKLATYTAGSNLYSTDLAAILGDLGTVPRTGDQIINTPKIDWQVNEKQHVSFLFHRLRWDSPGGVQTQATNNYAIDSFGTDFVKLDYGLARLDSLFTSSLSNEIRYQYSRELNDEGQQTHSAYTQKYFTGTSGVPVQVSLVSSSGFTAGIPYYSFRYAYPDERKWQVADTANWTHGGHNIKFGLDIVHNYDLQNNLFEGNGVYTYGFLQNYFADIANPNGTCNSTASATGVGTTAANTYPCYSSLVQGFGASVFDLSTLDYGFFVQDDWKVSPRLTLNLGLRYDYESLPQPYSNLINPLFPATGNRPADKNNIGPRIGFAWDPFGQGTTVLRGGYGLYYGRIFNSMLLNTYENTGLVAGQNTYSFKNTVRASGNTPLAIFPNALTAAPTTIASPNIEYFSKNMQNPSVNEFDLTVQQQFARSTTASVTYLSALGRQLPNFLNVNLNPATTYTSTVTVQPATTGGTCGPLACGTKLTNQVFQGGQNNAFAAVTEVLSNINSNYQGLVGEIQNHSMKLIQFDANYTWSHALDYNQNQSTSASTNNWLNPYANARANYANSNFNVPNRFVGYALINFPSVATGWKSYLANGWQVNPLVQVQNGLPYSLVLSGFQPGNSFGSGILGSGVTYFPQVGRNTYQQKRTAEFDLRAQKEFVFADRYHLQLIGEGFNMLNHVNVTSVNTTGYTFSGSNLNYNAAAGTVTNANSNYVYSPRQVQLAVRLEF
jgi:outer membrane receptor protein involved in Fe transport